MTMTSCDSCSGFVPPAANRCPCCEAAVAPQRWRRLGRALLAVAGSGAVAVTLMACYGAPAQYHPVAPQPPAAADAGPDQVAPDAGAEQADDTSGDDTEAPPDPTAATPE